MIRETRAALGKLLPLLPGQARRFMMLYAVASSSLSLLDIAALGLLALALGPMVQGNPVRLPVVGLVHQSGYVWVVVAVSALIVVKGVLSVGLQWVVTRRFAIYELEIGDRLFEAYIRAPWTARLQRNTSELVRLADVGIANVTGGFLLQIASLPSLVATFVSVLVVLLVAQPVTALITLVYMGLVGAFLYFWVSRRSIVAGRVNRDVSFRVARLMTEMVGALKEITLRGKAPEVAAVVHADRIHTTRARANLALLASVPRFVMESALVGGFVLVGGAAYVRGGMPAALSALALFAVAGFRMVPSVTAFQAIASSAAANIPHVQAVIRDIDSAKDYIRDAERLGLEPLASEPRVLSARGVAFTYPGAAHASVHGVDFDVLMGSNVAIVGATGAGKSTLVDVLLGLLRPTAGKIELDGRPLGDVLAAWRSRVGYVPQVVSLFDATIAQNVALTWSNDIDRAKVRACLTMAHLLEDVESRPGGLDARIGESGIALSGGQRQRLGIARALYADPLVLVLDEATSSLDTQTEASVTRAIAQLTGRITVISVAHRLATIRDADQVLFMAQGTVVARGTFDEVVRDVPDFAAQAALAGLA